MTSKPDIPVVQSSSLTRRAALTFLSNILQQGARLLVGLVVTPIVIRGLGAELYGAWTMIQQTMGYLSLSDLRPAGTLKFMLAVRQHVSDLGEKQRLIGASLILWAITFPFIILLGAGAIWLSPAFIRVGPTKVIGMQIALGLVTLSVALDRILSLPSNVLRGQNLDYRGMGLSAGTVLLGGAMTGFAVWAGWGLPGVASAAVLSAAASGCVRFLVARRALPWLAASRPARSEMIAFAQLSGWLFFSSLTGLMLGASDILLVGVLLGPTAAAVYATTGAVLRLASEPLSQLLSSGNAGLAGLCGQGEWRRLAQLRTEMHVLAISIMAVIGTGVLVLNESFLRLWVGEGFFGGMQLNFMLVLAAFLMLLFRIDAIIVDGLLQFREKAWAMLLGGLLSLLTGLMLLPSLGSMGMAIGTSLGHMSVIVCFWRLLGRRLDISLSSYARSMMRPTVLSGALLVAAYAIAPWLSIDNWIGFSLVAGTSGGVLSLAVWSMGLPAEVRAGLLRRAYIAATARK